MSIEKPKYEIGAKYEPAGGPQTLCDIRAEYSYLVERADGTRAWHKEDFVSSFIAYPAARKKKKKASKM